MDAHTGILAFIVLPKGCVVLRRVVEGIRIPGSRQQTGCGTLKELLFFHVLVEAFFYIVHHLQQGIKLLITLVGFLGDGYGIAITSRCGSGISIPRINAQQRQISAGTHDAQRQQQGKSKQKFLLHGSGSSSSYLVRRRSPPHFFNSISSLKVTASSKCRRSRPV